MGWTIHVKATFDGVSPNAFDMALFELISAQAADGFKLAETKASLVTKILSDGFKLAETKASLVTKILSDGFKLAETKASLVTKILSDGFKLAETKASLVTKILSDGFKLSEPSATAIRTHTEGGWISVFVYHLIPSLIWSAVTGITSLWTKKDPSSDGWTKE